MRWSRFYLVDNADLYCDQHSSGDKSAHRDYCKNIPGLWHLDICSIKLHLNVFGKREYLRLPSDFAFSLEREAILLPEYQVTCFGESPVIFPINVAELIRIS